MSFTSVEKDKLSDLDSHHCELCEKLMTIKTSLKSLMHATRENSTREYDSHTFAFDIELIWFAIFAY